MRYPFIFSSFLFLAACNHYSEKLNSMNPSGGTFTDYLAMEYCDLARRENTETMDYPAARYFTEKAEKAEKGELVAPGFPFDFSVPDEYGPELAQARDQLSQALSGVATSPNPQALARAQAAYDCWLDEQAEVHKSGAALTCKAKFQTALVESASAPVADIAPSAGAPAAAAIQADIAPAPQAQQQPTPVAMTASPVAYKIGFTGDRPALDQTAIDTISQAAAQAKADPLASVVITSYGDMDGQGIAVTRSALVAAGIAAGRIHGALVPGDRPRAAEISIRQLKVQ